MMAVIVGNTVIYAFLGISAIVAIWFCMFLFALWYDRRAMKSYSKPRQYHDPVEHMMDPPA